MNGRCENDALDGATDVCDACGGEFCPNCLLYPNGQKKVPLCTACAIATSGVRKAAKRERLQSRSSASKRRKELRKLAAEGQGQTVVVVEDHDFGVDEPAPKKKRLRRKTDAAKEAAIEPEIEETFEQPDEHAFVPFEFDGHEAPGSATKMLDEIRTTGGVDSQAHEAAEDWNFPSDFSEPHAQPDQVFPTEDFEIQFEEQIEPRYEPEAEFSPPAEPESYKTAPPSWETLHNPDASNPFDDPSVGRASKGSGYNPASEPATPSASSGALHGSPFAEDGPIPPPPQHRTPSSDLPTPGPEHRSPSPETAQAFNIDEALAESLPGDPAPQELAAPAPLVQPKPEPRKKRRHLLKAMTNPAVPVVQAEEVAQERVQDPTTDTDAAGQWIPPNLRGMVSADEQTELPKRQRNG